MEVLITANGALTMVIVPTNEMEVEMLKRLANQKNEIHFTTNGIQIVNKQVPQGLVISKETGTLGLPDNNNQEQDTEDRPPFEFKDETES